MTMATTRKPGSSKSSNVFASVRAETAELLHYNVDNL